MELRLRPRVRAAEARVAHGRVRQLRVARARLRLRLARPLHPAAHAAHRAQHRRRLHVLATGDIITLIFLTTPKCIQLSLI